MVELVDVDVPSGMEVIGGRRERRNLKGSCDRVGGVRWQMMVMTWNDPKLVGRLFLDNTVYPFLMFF